MSKHTPGPWTLQPCEAHSEDGRDIAEVRGGDRIIFSEEVVDAECLANAKLIAAAPDLLDALTDTLDSLEYVRANHPDVSGCGVREERIEKAKAAIAKATN